MPDQPALSDAQRLCPGRVGSGGGCGCSVSLCWLPELDGSSYTESSEEAG